MWFQWFLIKNHFCKRVPSIHKNACGLLPRGSLRTRKKALLPEAEPPLSCLLYTSQEFGLGHADFHAGVTRQFFRRNGVFVVRYVDVLVRDGEGVRSFGEVKGA